MMGLYQIEKNVTADLPHLCNNRQLLLQVIIVFVKYVH